MSNIVLECECVCVWVRVCTPTSLVWVPCLCCADRMLLLCAAHGMPVSAHGACERVLLNVCGNVVWLCERSKVRLWVCCHALPLSQSLSFMADVLCFMCSVPDVLFAQGKLQESGLRECSGAVWWLLLLWHAMLLWSLLRC